MEQKWYDKLPFGLGEFRLINWVSFVSMMTLMSIGTMFIYSANAARENVRLQSLYLNHGQIAVVALGITAILALINYKNIIKWSWFFYAFSIFLLLAVLFFGDSIMGARRWVFGVQPSEFAKLSTIMVLAEVLSRKDARRDFLEFLMVVGIVMLPVGLILCQPDLGTSLVFFPIAGAMMFIAGTAPKVVGTTFLAAVLSVVLVLSSVAIKANENSPKYLRMGANVATCVLNDYQEKRLLDYLYPDRDPLGKGWNRRQSQIAIGSGGMWGKGFLKGDQNILGYLPQQVSANDFIFSVLAEEKGFAGSVFVLLCYAGLILPALFVAAICPDGMGRLLCVGIAVLLFCHIFINIGMTIGIIPVTGLPLPFMSYGRTFVLVATLAMGLIQSVSVHSRNRKTINIGEE